MQELQFPAKVDTEYLVARLRQKLEHVAFAADLDFLVDLEMLYNEAVHFINVMNTVMDLAVIEPRTRFRRSR